MVNIKKRISALITAFLFFAVGCFGMWKLYNDGKNSILKKIKDEETILEDFVDGIEKKEIEITEKTVKSVSGGKRTNGGSSDKQKAVSSDFDVKTENVVTDEVIKEPNIAKKVNNLQFINNHISLSANEYYQYSNLNSSEKALYDRIVNTIEQSKCVVDTLSFNMENDIVATVFQKVMADHPQYFYISRNCITVFRRNQNRVKSLIILYTDGVTTDGYDDSIRIKKVANRGKINNEIITLKNSAEQILNKIPSNIPDVYKEKIIHDYIAKNVKYDSAAAENIQNYGPQLPHAFDLYGGMVDGSAVCEGYSKMFQYLCYCVGINSTQVTGTYEGGNHMWNTVKIGGEWYHIDLTFDDASSQVSYTYFNLTTAKIAAERTIEKSKAAVPECSATEYSFENVFAVKITNLSKAPENYEGAMEAIMTTNDKNVYFWFSSGVSGNSNKRISYLKKFCLSSLSGFYKNLAYNGLYLKNEYYQSGNYIIVPLK